MEALYPLPMSTPTGECVGGGGGMGLHSANHSLFRMGDGVETSGSESTLVPVPVHRSAKGTAKSSSLLDPTLPS